MDKPRLEILKQDGWVRRFVTSEPRLSEAVEIYREAGFEVILEPISIEENESDGFVCSPEMKCRKCFQGSEDEYKIIFTRKEKCDSKKNCAYVAPCKK